MASAYTEDDLAAIYSAWSQRMGDPASDQILSSLLYRVSEALYPPNLPALREFRSRNCTYRVDISDRFARSLVYASGQEHSELQLFQNLCSPGHEVWDVGANFGLYAVLAGKYIGSAGRVVAIEPNSQCEPLLAHNVRQNGLDGQTTIFTCAAGMANGRATFFETVEPAFSGLSDTGRVPVKSQRQVSVKSLDHLWQKQGHRPLNLVKLDVEGHEGATILGGLKAFAASPTAIIQFEYTPKNLNPELSQQLFTGLSDLQSMGFELWSLWETEQPQQLSLSGDTSWQDHFNTNLYLARTGETVARLHAAHKKTLADLAKETVAPDQAAKLGRVIRLLAEDAVTQRKLHGYETALHESREKRDRLREALEEANAQIVNHQETLSSARAQAESARLLTIRQKEQLAEFSARESMREQQSKEILYQLKQQIKNLNAIIAQKSQVITNHNKRFGRLERDQAHKDQKHAAMVNENDTLRQRITEKNEQNGQFKNMLERRDQQIVQQQERVNQLQENVEAFRALAENKAAKINHLQDKIERHTRHIEQKAEAEKTLAAQVEAFKSLAQRLKQDVAARDAQIKDLSAAPGPIDD